MIFCLRFFFFVYHPIARFDVLLCGDKGEFHIYRLEKCGWQMNQNDKNDNQKKKKLVFIWFFFSHDNQSKRMTKTFT